LCRLRFLLELFGDVLRLLEELQSFCFAPGVATALKIQIEGGDGGDDDGDVGGDDEDVNGDDYRKGSEVQAQTQRRRRRRRRRRRCTSG
jgi:hypothetical protein